MASDANASHAVECSIGLVDKALALLGFLRDVDKVPAFYTSKSVFRNALRRYEFCWIPFIQKYTAEDQSKYVTRLDVAWVWFCHILAPVTYRKDMRKISGPGPVLNHSILTRHERSARVAETRKDWETIYPNELYEFLSLSDDDSSSDDSDYGDKKPSRITYDIYAADDVLLSSFSSSLS